MTTTTAVTRHPRRHATHPLANREKRTALNYAFRDRGVPVKICSRCYAVKALGAFNRHKISSDGLCSYCRQCHAGVHAHKQANDPAYREKHRAAALAYNAAHVEERRAYGKRRRAVVRERNKERNATRVQDPNVRKRCAGQCQRILPETEFTLDRRTPDGLRLRCRSCAVSWRRARQACRSAYGDPVGLACYLCGTAMTTSGDAQVDHLIPQSCGGPDTAENVRWTHGACNRERFNKPLTSEQIQRALAFGPLPSSLSGELL